MEMECKHQRGHAPSSFGMQDSALVFETLALQPGHVFLDLGCGLGEYALHAARLVGDMGVVYALDRTDSIIEDLERRGHIEKISNVTAMAADITQPLPMKSESVDRCLLATVLHIPDVVARVEPLCAEIRRVLKPEGRLVIIDCYSKDLTFGPPESMRLPPDQVRTLIAKHGFSAMEEIDLGFNYLIQFQMA